MFTYGFTRRYRRYVLEVHGDPHALEIGICDGRVSVTRDPFAPAPQIAIPYHVVVRPARSSDVREDW